jgi:uncharacterized membrane-anchored protein
LAARQPAAGALIQSHPMQVNHLPTINARYWCAIVVASMAGANTGDFAARYLHLGHTRGLLPLALIFLAIVWAETQARRATEAYYWLAIIVLRTGATNLADLMTHDLRLGYPLTLAALTALIVAVLLFVYWRDGAAVPASDGRKLPATDSAYWLAMLTAGTLGTAGGDFVADEVGLGVGYGSLVLLAVFFVVLLGATRIGKMSLFWYWAAIVAARTAGTTMGDFLPSRRGLDLGLPLSTAITLTTLALIVILWRARRAAALATETR